MRTIFNISAIILLLTSTIYGQTTLNVKGKIKCCEGNSLSKDIMINLLAHDSIIQTAFSDASGNFAFHDLINADDYSLKISYYGQTLNQIQSKVDSVSKADYQERVHSICCQAISKQTKDSLIQNWSKNLLTIYYYGMPLYSDSQVYIISMKYGVRYENMGCVVYSDEENMNDKVKTILNQKLGNNWEKTLWNELRKMYKK